MKINNLKLFNEEDSVRATLGGYTKFAFRVSTLVPSDNADIAGRIVSCVNACNGMPDPIATVNHMKNQLENWETIRLERESEEMIKLKALVYDLREEIDRLRLSPKVEEHIEEQDKELKEVRRVARELYMALSALTYGTTREFADSNGFGQQRDRAITLLKNTPPPPLQTTPTKS